MFTTVYVNWTVIRSAAILVWLVTIARLFAESDAELKTRIDRGQKEAERRASKLCEQLPGYESFKKEFTFGQPPYVGLVNGFPESIYAWIDTKRPRLVDAVWWWDPIDKSGKPKVDWNQLRTAYKDASRHVSTHSWLKDWKSAQRGRSIELHLFGTQIGETELEMKTAHIPAWKIAGFKGVPGYSFLLRRPDDSWIQVLFGRDDPRAVVTESFVRPRDGKTRHWLDKFDLFFHPKGRRGEMDKYLVISPTGEHELKTYGKAKGGSPRKMVPASYAGGDGSSFEKAIIIHASDEKSGVDAEYAYLKKHFPDYVTQSQSLKEHNGKAYDVLEFRTAGKKRVIHFDISSFFGRH